MDNEEILSTPATPGTPGAPLFVGFKGERTGNGNGRKSLLKNCKCFSVEEWTLEDGALPRVSCSLPVAPPPVSLARNVPAYIAAQVLASICATFAVKGIFHPFMGGGVTVPSGDYSQAFALEFIISFNLTFVVTAVATDTRAVGATVMVIAGLATGASMNPVRTLGPAIAANNYKAIWVYLIAPILGALGWAGTYTAVKLPGEDGDTLGKGSTPRSFRR
ncbi:hypothetical protein L6164_021657 [Bauhinia variegata]|uniref:Uncharacterized protein n=1 Tax=Bauhinia variegata TaxID=167791 RepID=A0ACB9N182_BAUVA|nr:hypothetical protein L6164_021657 [Bauhinia variegata]